MWELVSWNTYKLVFLRVASTGYDEAMLLGTWQKHVNDIELSRNSSGRTSFSGSTSWLRVQKFWYLRSSKFVSNSKIPRICEMYISVNVPFDEDKDNGNVITALAYVEHHGKQPTGCMDHEPEPSRGVPCKCLSTKTDHFRLNPTQSCALRRRCDRVSSMYHLALGSAPAAADMRPTPWFSPAFISSTSSIHAPIKPTLSTTTPICQLWASRPPSSRN